MRQAPRADAIAATTAHAVTVGRLTNRISLRRFVIIDIPVSAPLPYVAAHIVQTEFVGVLGGYRMSFASAVAAVHCNGIEVVATTVFVAAALAASAYRVFPLCLSGEIEILARSSCSVY